MKLFINFRKEEDFWFLDKFKDKPFTFFYDYLPKNTPLPVKRTNKYTTENSLDTSVKIKIYQGERTIANKNFLIGEYIFDKISTITVPIIEITFKIDLNSIINVTITDKKSGIDKSIIIKDIVKYSEEEVDDIIKKSSKLNILDENELTINQNIYLINTDTLERLRLSIDEDGTIGDGNITRIAILSRSDTPSYARQNELLPGKWINIYFEGDFPVIITGKITNLENDMIEIKTVDDDVIYINFDYKGLPENLPIQMIEIREKPSEPLVQVEKEQPEEEPLEEIPQLEVEKKFVEPEKIQLTIPVKDIKNQIREFIVKADQVQFGDEESKIIQIAKVECELVKRENEFVKKEYEYIKSSIFWRNDLTTDKGVNNKDKTLNNFKKLFLKLK